MKTTLRLLCVLSALARPSLALAQTAVPYSANVQMPTFIVPAGANNVTGILTTTVDGLVTTSTDGLVLQNTTAATSGVTVQISPRVKIRGNGWDTAASQTLDFFMETLPASAATPTATFNLGFSRNGGAATLPMTVSSTGVVTVLSSYGLAGTGFVSWNSRSAIASTTNGSFNVIKGDNSSGVRLQFAGDPVIGVCGTSPSMTTGSTDTEGELTVGSGGTLTSCAITFNATWSNAPRCVANVSTATAGNTRSIGTTTTTTTMTLTPSAAFAASDKVWWICLGSK